METTHEKVISPNPFTASIQIGSKDGQWFAIGYNHSRREECFHETFDTESAALDFSRSNEAKKRLGI